MSLLALHNITKTFGPLKALTDLSFEVGHSEVVGLLGDNGAGKSTTVNMLSGIHRPSSGYISVDGQRQDFANRRDSAEAGIETIYQNTALVDCLSISRNIFLGRELTDRFGFLDLKQMRDIAMQVLESAVHISGIDSPDKLVGDLSGGQKQAVAIARAVFFKRRILLLDEPTSALSVRETEALLGQVLKLKAEGVSSVLVTHNLYHAHQVCDRFVIMSHGTKVFDVAKADTTIEELTRHVVLT
ncbi:ATP-binding cassette domain-containing protein [Devosia psychrophila]|uniref:ABC transporter ATP-binding protein n=1 Tax=Devosia psychrophila TaxID=728005 RepID=A0A0F5Q1E7_9HYPH|nr:ATP-binding cassette domain-containing protein [Devosia psychrophila]KKC33904.1 ABC transporter ATP-binding protein [Devosia psychrophila]SFC84028.1 simple sugar transport system ATP-binding protein [Devosia psychrophila]